MLVAGKRALVVGLGRSGLAAARLLLRKGAQVIGNDLRPLAELGEEVRDLVTQGLTLALGHHDGQLMTTVDLVVVSPGVPKLDGLNLAAEAGIPVVSEVELASWFIPGTLVGITGTNGKSTVTSLLGRMVQRSGKPCFVGGNLGTPLIEVVDTEACLESGVVIAELSSFQLERVPGLRVNVAAVLNLSDDHLDRYDGFAEYVAAKGNLFKGQTREDCAVVPAGDAACEELVRLGKAQLYSFGAPDGSVTVVEGRIVDSNNGLSLPVEALGIRGAHNIKNACAAALLARLLGVQAHHIDAVLREFSGLPHRMQWVGARNGVDYFDDSKATNVGAAVASLAGVTKPVVLIAGGVDKGGSYEPLAQALGSRARACVLLGEAAPLIRSALCNLTCPVMTVSSMDLAVTQASALAQPGDVVLLAPACSSFDMFGSYAERGHAFRSAVVQGPLGGAS